VIKSHFFISTPQAVAFQLFGFTSKSAAQETQAIHIHLATTAACDVAHPQAVKIH